MMMKPQAQTFGAAVAIADTGDLSTTPFAELLVALFDEQRTGTLQVTDEHGGLHALISFQAGSPVAARVPLPENGLMEILIPLCARTEGSYRFDDGVDRDDAFGDAPEVVKGVIDPLALIAAAMRGPVREDAVNRTLAQLGASVLKLNPRTDLERYAFTAQEKLALSMLWQGPVEDLQLQGQTDVAPRLLRRLVYVLAITRGITVLHAANRGTSGTIAHAAPVAGAARRAVRVEKPTQLVPLDTPFSSAQGVQRSATILEHPARPVPNGERARRSRRLASQPVTGTGDAGRYHVRNPAEGMIEMPASALELGLPRDLPPVLQIWCSEILERARLITRQNYYEVLGLERDCNVEQIEVAYATLVKRFEPDQLPVELDGVRERAQAILGQALQASETLRDATRRREYDRELDAGGSLGMRPSVQRSMQAEAHYRRAEALLKRKDYAGSQQETERAMAMGGACARYEALYGWLLYLRTATTGRVHPRAREHLDMALKRDPRCEQAHYFLAEVLKQTGKPDQAYQHFKRVLKLNPGHLEAAREARLYEMRHKPQSGILDRLLGRKPSVRPSNKPKPAAKR